MTDAQFRPIAIEGIAPVKPLSPDAGAVPMQQWLAIASLIVDPAYQREIGGAGRINVRRIAADFRWVRFSPVIVAPVAGGLYAIIDGQHRATAALMRGYDKVPCQIIIADQAAQADAFRAINGSVTRMSAMAIHHAAVVAGDPEAVEIDRICRATGVRILRSVMSAEHMRKGDTLAAGSLRRVYREYNSEMLRLTLRCITGTANNVPGAVNSLTILALSQLIAGDGELRSLGDKLLRIFDRIEIEQESLEFQQGRGARPGTLASAFADHLAACVVRVRHNIVAAPPPPAIRKVAGFGRS
jgi:hypothetical protein